MRVISALAAAAIVLSLGYWGERPGLYFVCSVAIILGIREFSRMAFKKGQVPWGISALFWLVSLAFYGAMVDHYEQGLQWIALANLTFFSGSLWIARGRCSNEILLPSLALGSLGMNYCVLFPFFAIQTVQLEHGPLWFFFLLLVVFAGDTFAYFGGRLVGGAKLMPAISPNKTFAGAVSGLLGSAVMGCLYAQWQLSFVGIGKVIAFALVCGAVAQSGDLLVSLIKRVAHVKDSGHLMPGHGGVLDRLDGIFISFPLVYSFALYVNPQ